MHVLLDETEFLGGGSSTGPAVPAGTVTLSDWAVAVESVLHLGLPWRMLRPQLVNSSADNVLEYKSWLESLAKEQLSREVRGWLGWPGVHRSLRTPSILKQLFRAPKTGWGKQKQLFVMFPCVRLCVLGVYIAASINPPSTLKVLLECIAHRA